MRKQRVVLEDHADAPALGRDRAPRAAHDLAVQHDLAFTHRFEACDTPQHRRLAAPAGAEEAADRAGLEAERKHLQHGPAVVRLADAADFE
jgi:hypothetical protein